jgi:hypothetical protein
MGRGSIAVSNSIFPPPSPILEMIASGKVACRSRVGGIVNFYLREAA